MWRSCPPRIGWSLLAICLALFLRLANVADFAEKFVIPTLADNPSATLIGVLLGSLLGGIALARPVVRRLGRAFVPSDVTESCLSPVDRAGRDARIVRRIGRVSQLMAGVGVMFGLGLIRLAAAEAAAGRRPLALRAFLLPVMTGITGYVSGRAGTYAITSRSFLSGPAGRPYLEKIGTGNIIVARVACALFGVVFVLLSLFVIGLLLVPPFGDEND